MSLYTHILAAVELDDSGPAVLARAQELAVKFGAHLAVLHVVEYVAIDAGEALMAAPPDLSRQLLDQARVKLLELCAPLGIAAESVSAVSGSITTEIPRVARERRADLVIVGHPPRRGLSSWFSHTEQDVVQRAPCDVLVLNLS
ncbi:MAG TPA: universal stress protein [Solimonas sp.]|nr:universal stress protein [Solimonas sp.]